MKSAHKRFISLFWARSLTRAAVVLAAFGLAAAVQAAAQAPVPDSPAIEAQAHAMLNKLTLEQKIVLLGGEDGMFTRAMPSIGLPRFKMSDASVGVRTWGPTTAYAGGVALAATWDPAFARKLGESLGGDARARSVNFLLGPGVDIARAPVGGRNFEYLSEDPYLNSALDVPYIEGVQSEGVVATVKHYALNNEEYNRHNSSSDVDERTMREIYLPAYEAAVTKAHVDAVMDSYNEVNGVHSTQNPFLNLKVLKGDWGFKGILMSDWDATYNGVAAANNGLDLEMPSALFMNAKTLLPAVKDGTVKESTIDDKVLRLLRVELRYGFTQRPQFDPAVSTYSVADRAVALEGALESITLLKNEGHLLPLDAAKIKTIAIVGPDAWPAVPGGGGSSHATAFDPVSILTGIANFLGPNVHVLYSRGLPDLADVFRNTQWDGGVHVETFPSRDFTGTPLTGVHNSVADWRQIQFQPQGQAPRSIRYTAAFKAGNAGRYLLIAAAAGHDAYKVSVDGSQALEQGDEEGQVPHSKAIELSAGQTAHIVADYLPYAAGTRFGLGIAYEPDLVSADAKRFASLADVVVVAAGFDAETEGEGHDRTFALPWGQDALIQAMAAANPHTVVALTGGGGMETQSWLDKVPALLHLWYPGQEGGTALAEVLFGKHDPEGRLPVTFDRTWPDSASYAWYYPKGPDTTLRETGADGKPVEYSIAHIVYGDKLMVGYRYWTTAGKHPLFPFGFGLSYTTFRFSDLHAPATATTGATVPVSFDVTNTGKVAGAEVAQLYVSDPSAKVDRPERALKGFEKVRLAPGETKRVTFDLDARSFSYWDETAQKWTIDPGKFVIRVGDSSENTPLDANLTLE
ncbi:MAG: beta-glucosidase family protein [Terracidiphilus sp.]